MGDFKSLRKQEKLLNTYSEERECNYKDRHYRIRDNGSVMRGFRRILQSHEKATMNGPEAMSSTTSANKEKYRWDCSLMCLITESDKCFIDLCSSVDLSLSITKPVHIPSCKLKRNFKVDVD